MDQQGIGPNGEIMTQRLFLNRRALAVMNYLIRKGVNPSQLKYRAGGHFDDPKMRKTTIRQQ